MKKIINILFVFLISFLLVSCKETGFPTVKGKDRVDLSSEEAQEKLLSLDFPSDKIVKQEISGELTMVFDGEMISSKLEGTGYYSTDKFYFKQRVTSSHEGENVKIDQEFYLQDDYLYMKTEGMGQNSKYKINIEDAKDSLDETGLVDYDTAFNEETIQNLFDDTFFNNEFSGLGFYKKGNKFSVKVEVTKENRSELAFETRIKFRDYFKDLISVYETLFGSYTSLEYLIIIEATNDVITSIGYQIFLKSDQFGLKMDIVMRYVKSMPKLKNLETYAHFPLP